MMTGRMILFMIVLLLAGLFSEAEPSPLNPMAIDEFCHQFGGHQL
jgi:hypothetical protein